MDLPTALESTKSLVFGAVPVSEQQQQRITLRNNSTTHPLRWAS